MSSALHSAALPSTAPSDAYKDAYAEATRILKVEFGEGAVARGAVRIEGTAVAVPRKGLASVRLENGRQMHILLSGDDAYVCVVFGDGVKPSRAGRASVERARRAWAVLRYLDQAAPGTDAQIRAGVNLGRGAAVFRKGTVGPGPDLRDGTASRLSEAVAETARRAGFGALMRDLNGALRADSSGARDAWLAAFEAFFPPRGPGDDFRVQTAFREISDIDAQLALTLARRMEPPPLFAPWVRRIPRVGEKAYFARLSKVQAWPSPDPVLLWQLRTLAGKTGDQRRALLEAAAFPGPIGAVMTEGEHGCGVMTDAVIGRMAAQPILAREYPERWRDLLVEHFHELNEGDKLNFLPVGRAPLGADERFARLVAHDPPPADGELGPLARVNAWRDLYLVTKDSAVLDELAQMALLGDREQASIALGATLQIVGKERPPGGVPYWLPRAMRRFSTLAKDAMQSRSWRLTEGGVLTNLPGWQAADAGALLERVMETQNPEESPEEVRRIRDAWLRAGIRALGKIHAQESAAALARIVEDPSTPEAVRREAARALFGLRAAGALGPMETIAEDVRRMFPGEPQLGQAAARGIEAARLLAAGDRIAHYRSLAWDRSALLEPDDLAGAFDAEALRTLLGTEETGEAVERLLTALLVRLRRDDEEARTAAWQARQAATTLHPAAADAPAAR